MLPDALPYVLLETVPGGEKYKVVDFILVINAGLLAVPAVWTKAFSLALGSTDFPKNPRNPFKKPGARKATRIKDP